MYARCNDVRLQILDVRQLEVGFFTHRGVYDTYGRSHDEN